MRFVIKCDGTQNTKNMAVPVHFNQVRPQIRFLTVGMPSAAMLSGASWVLWCECCVSECFECILLSFLLAWSFPSCWGWRETVKLEVLFLTGTAMLSAVFISDYCWVSWERFIVLNFSFMFRLAWGVLLYPPLSQYELNGLCSPILPIDLEESECAPFFCKNLRAVVSKWIIS